MTEEATPTRRRRKPPPFLDFLGAEVLTMEPGVVEVRLPYRDNLSRFAGSFHGGAIAALFDYATAMTAGTLIPRESGMMSVTVEFKLNFVAPAGPPEILCRTKVIRAGKSVSLVQGEVFVVAADGTETLCATGTSTMVARPIPPGVSFRRGAPATG